MSEARIVLPTAETEELLLIPAAVALPPAPPAPAAPAGADAGTAVSPRDELWCSVSFLPFSRRPPWCQEWLEETKPLEDSPPSHRRDCITLALRTSPGPSAVAGRRWGVAKVGVSPFMWVKKCDLAYFPGTQAPREVRTTRHTIHPSTKSPPFDLRIHFRPTDRTRWR